MSNNALSAPPEGVLVGESVPRENEIESRKKQLLDQTMSHLKSYGEPYTTMSDSELREKALEILHKVGSL